MSPHWCVTEPHRKLNIAPFELASHAGGASDLARLCTLMAGGRLDGQIELEASWREPSRALSALLQRRIGGKAVLNVD